MKTVLKVELRDHQHDLLVALAKQTVPVTTAEFDRATGHKYGDQALYEVFALFKRKGLADCESRPVTIKGFIYNRTYWFVESEVTAFLNQPA